MSINANGAIPAVGIAPIDLCIVLSNALDELNPTHEAALWIFSVVTHAILAGLCAVLFYLLLRFSSKEPIIGLFPCKNSVFAVVLSAAALIKIAESICMPGAHASPVIREFANTQGFRWMNTIAFLWDTVIVVAIFMVAVYADIQMRKSEIPPETG